MKKITEEQKTRIQELLKEGKSQVEIAQILGIRIQKVNYWSSNDIRTRQIKGARDYFLKKSPEQKKEYYESRREYLKEYMKKKYKEDPIFREKQKERARKNKRKLRELKGGKK